MGQRTLENLNSQTKSQITIVNRTLEKAQEIARTQKVNFAPIDSLTQEIAKANVVVVATSSKKYTINHDHINDLKTEKLFIDLSVPRNIDPKCASNKYVELVDIDQLNAEADNTLDKLEDFNKDLPKAKTIINLHKLEFEDWSKLHTLGPTIKNLKMILKKLKTQKLKNIRDNINKMNWNALNL